MRWSPLLLACVAACGAPSPAHPTSSAPAPALTLTPAPAPAPAPALSPTTPPATCALTDVTLPVHLAPCSAPGAKDYETESDLAVDVDRFPATLRSGAAVELTVTMKNATRVPLTLRLSESQTLTFEVSRAGDPNDGPTEVIEPLPQPGAGPMPASCAHVSCDGPLMAAQPRPPRPVLTLAPGGIARVRGTWQPRRWKVPPPKVNGCCDVVQHAPVAVGPLGPGGYTVQMPLPLDEAYGGSPGIPRARADIDIIP
jgi:hypothetical protein